MTSRTKLFSWTTTAAFGLALLARTRAATSTDASYIFNSYDSHLFVNTTTNRVTGENFSVSDDGNALFGTNTQLNIPSSDPFSIFSNFTGLQTFTGGGGSWENTFGAAPISGTFLQTSAKTADLTVNFIQGTLAVLAPATASLLLGLG